MESSVMSADTNTSTTLFNYNSSSSASSPPPPPPPPHPAIVASPCAACKILRRRCVDKCVLAPYFPPTEPLKFTTAHRVFGASNIIKFLQELPESRRADAVSSMVYEANARIRDPVYGCAGAICHLQKQVTELQAELARAQAELVKMQTQHANLVAIICMEMTNSQQQQQQQQQQYCPLPSSAATLGIENIPNSFLETESFFVEDVNTQGSLWEEPLWT